MRETEKERLSWIECEVSETWFKDDSKDLVWETGIEISN